jgi:flavoprotein
MNTRVKDLTAKRFGALLVTGFSHIFKSRSHWNCVCECGRKTIVASNNLRKTKVNQCGKCKSKPLEEAMSMIIMRDYKFRAWKKDLPFKLSSK